MVISDRKHLKYYKDWLKNCIVWCFSPYLGSDLNSEEYALYSYLYRNYKMFGVSLLIVEGISNDMSPAIKYYDKDGVILWHKATKSDANVFIARDTDKAGVSECKSRPPHQNYIIVDSVGGVVESSILY